MSLTSEDRQEIRNIAREEINAVLARIASDLHQAYLGDRFNAHAEVDALTTFLSERILSATRWNS